MAPVEEKLEDVFAKVNEQLARGTWTPVTPAMIAAWSLQETETFTVLADKPALTDGRIELRKMALNSSLKFRDGAVRARVRLIEGMGLGFGLRGQGGS